MDLKQPALCTSAIGAAGVQYAAAELMRNGIIPSFPLFDQGYDLLADSGGRIFRLQVKTQGPASKTGKTVTRFSLMRMRSSRRSAKQRAQSKRRYTGAELDVMVFVHMRTNRIFVVPVSEIDFSKTWISFPDDSQWLNAWWALQSISPKARAANKKRK